MIIDFDPINRTQSLRDSKKKQPSMKIETIEEAKKHGNIELKKLEEISSKYIDEINELAIVDAVKFGESISFMVNDAIQHLYKPIINSDKRVCSSEKSYNEIRLQIFSSLIKKYDIEINIKDKEGD